MMVLWTFLVKELMMMTVMMVQVTWTFLCWELKLFSWMTGRETWGWSSYCCCRNCHSWMKSHWFWNKFCSSPLFFAILFFESLSYQTLLLLWAWLMYWWSPVSVWLWGVILLMLVSPVDCHSTSSSTMVSIAGRVHAGWHTWTDSGADHDTGHCSGQLSYCHYYCQQVMKLYYSLISGLLYSSITI